MKTQCNGNYAKTLRLNDRYFFCENCRLCELSSQLPDWDENAEWNEMTQQINELYPYGVMDYTTQAKLDSVLNGSNVKSDTSYKKAVEIFKSGNWEDYKQDWSNTDNN